MSSNALMGKKKNSTDRHKPGSQMVRIRRQYAEPLAALVERNASDNTEEVNRALRLLLEKEGLWPICAAAELLSCSSCHPSIARVCPNGPC